MPNEKRATVSKCLHGRILESSNVENLLNALTRLAVYELSDHGEETLCGITCCDISEPARWPAAAAARPRRWTKFSTTTTMVHS